MDVIGEIHDDDEDEETGEAQETEEERGGFDLDVWRGV